MVDSISSSYSSTLSSLQGLMSQKPNSTLTDDQKSTIADILSNYDASNISEDDAKEIWQALQDAGIQPQAGLKEAIEEAGFDAEEIRTLATGEQTPPPPPPPPASGTFGDSSDSTINASALSTLKDILADYDLNNLSTDDQTELMNKLSEAGLTDLGNLFDIKS